MAWTKIKTAMVIGTVGMLAAVSTTVTVKEVKKHQENKIWGSIQSLNSKYLSALPNVILIRPAAFGPRMGKGAVWTSRGRLASSHSMAALLGQAYDIDPSRVENREALPQGIYDFIDTIDKVSLADNFGQAPLIALQQMIRKEFSISAVFQSIDTNVFILRYKDSANGGLHPSKNDNRGPMSWGNQGEYFATNISMSYFTTWLQTRLQVPVIDETGLPGGYDFNLSWENTGDTTNATPLEEAVRNQLGLALEPNVRPVKMLRWRR